jgi:hypothetical protein
MLRAELIRPFIRLAGIVREITSRNDAGPTRTLARAAPQGGSMIDDKTAQKLRRITAEHAAEVMTVTTEGHKKMGRGVVVIQVDPDTEECNVAWTSVSKIVVKGILKMAWDYNRRIEDLLVIMPIGRLEGQGYLSQTILRGVQPQ